MNPFPEVGELGDNEAQGVIQAIEPILKQCCKRKVNKLIKPMRPKSINMFRGQALNVKVENGIT